MSFKNGVIKYSSLTVLIIVIAFSLHLLLTKIVEKPFFITKLVYLGRRTADFKVEHNLAIDSDKDGISDRNELQIFETNPLKTDSDDDGYSDLSEIANCYNPNSNIISQELKEPANLKGKLSYRQINEWKSRSLSYFTDPELIKIVDSWIISDGACVLDGDIYPLKSLN